MLNPFESGSVLTKSTCTQLRSVNLRRKTTGSVDSEFIVSGLMSRMQAALA
ncbi:MAG: hypothetical protein IPL73_05350 [Candidatus Obscuribacter sp.]|nr:hypothetical protein [Candidatus Obscuribacter sp.]